MAAPQEMSADQKAFHETVEHQPHRESPVISDGFLAAKPKAPGLSELWKHKRIIGWCTFKLDNTSVLFLLVDMHADIGFQAL
jgi:hypothetical protein